MSSLPQDFRYALRQLQRAPAFTVAAVLTLAVGIGANTAIFSLLDQALLRALPVHNPQELVELRFAGNAPGHTHSDGGDTPNARAYFSYPIYRDLRNRASAFNGLVAFSSGSVGFTWNNRSELLAGELVTGNYFPVLGVRAALGRTLLPSDETLKDGNPVAVLSYAYWSSQLGSDTTILNKTVTLNGYPFTIVGVAAPGFASARWGATPAVYIPMTMKREVTPNWDDLEDRRAQWLNIIGRLQRGETRSHAEASVNPIWYAIRSEEFKQLKTQTPRAQAAFLGKTHLALLDGAKGFSPLRSDVRTPLLVVMGMVLLVLAMACVNTASLLLVRAAARVREFSMRYALGASRGRVFRQLLLEGLLLGLMGAGLGLALAPQALQILTHLISGDSPSPFSTTLNSSVLLFTLGATLVVSVLFSLAPAAQFWKPDLLETLRTHGSSSGGSLSFRRTCVVLQIALSLLLLIGAGLFVRTIRNLRLVDTGIQTSHLVTFTINPLFAGYNDAQSVAVRQRVLEASAAIPGVRSVAATTDAELAGNSTSGDIVVGGYTAKEDEDMDVELPFVTADYFSTLGIPLVAGREFAASDTLASQPVAVVNEAFARHFFGSARNAIGHTLGRHDQATATIVGVVKDSHHSSPRDPIVRTVFRPDLQIGQDRNSTSPSGFAFYVRTIQAPDTTISLIRRTLHDTDSKLVIDEFRTMDSQIDVTLTNERVIAMLAASFGVIATLLAAIGLYGVLAYVTTQRTHEIGIRMAIGAGPASIAKLILREVLLLTTLSIAFAIPASILLGNVLRSQLFNVSHTDPLTYAGGISIVTLVALFAAALPAWRAATIDPLQALRIE